MKRLTTLSYSINLKSKKETTSMLHTIPQKEVAISGTGLYSLLCKSPVLKEFSMPKFNILNC